MYPLGEQFLVDYRRAKSDSKACIVGKKYRFFCHNRTSN